MDLKNFFANIGAVMTILYLMPQVIRTWKTKSTKDIALGMYILGTLGALFWTLYGVTLSSIQIIVTNSIVFVCSLSILFLKLKYK